MYRPPAAVEQVIADLVEASPARDLRRAAGELSSRYRAPRSGRQRFVAGDDDTLAYLAFRMPATYAADRAVFAEVHRRRPDLAPASLLDLGAGPGTAGWAGVDCWPSIRRIDAVERDQRFVRFADGLDTATLLPAVDVRWHVEHVGAAHLPQSDVVVASYLLGELPEGQVARFVRRLWDATGDTAVIVEPGTPSGYERIIVARRHLLELGAHIVAPCPSHDRCPLVDHPSWCHFAQRLPRSEAHRQVKDVRLPYEDEKYSYIAVSRRPGTPVTARVIGMPRRPGGVVVLPLCEGATVAERKVSRRHKDAYRRAKKLTWGSPVDDDLPT